jgi:hypothetical protein
MRGGKAGEDWRGKARRGVARRGKAGEDWRGAAWRGKARRGMAGPGEAWVVV